MTSSDVPIERSVVFRNLSYKFRWAGLEFADLPFIAAPTVFVVGICMVLGLSPLWGGAVGAVVAVGILLLKRGKPEGYLPMLLVLMFAPRRLSHKERDVVLGPFPIPRSDDNQ